jgi:hypothetical protein
MKTTGTTQTAEITDVPQNSVDESDQTADQGMSLGCFFVYT